MDGAHPDYRASGAVAELAGYLDGAHGMAPVWPGWDTASVALAVTLPLGGGLLLARHPDPGPSARTVEGTRVSWVPAPSGAAADAGRQPGAVAVLLRGVPTILAVPSESSAALAAVIWSEAFRLHLRRLGRAQAPRLAVPYPLEDPVASALSTIEGHLLGEAESATAEPEALAGAVALVRRERRGPLADEVIAYEDAVEVAEGLPAYVGLLAARRVPQRWTPGLHGDGGRGAPPSAEASPGAPAAPGPDDWPAAGLGEGLGRLSPQRRLTVSGTGIALLLERCEPSWKAAVEGGATLTALLEGRASFDGGPRDDAVLQQVEWRFDYPGLLAAERARLTAARRAREALVDSVLRGSGTLLVVDVSALGPGDVRPRDPGQEVNPRLVVYPAGAAFHYSGAELRVDGRPVAEDRHAGLLQVRMAGSLRAAGDGSQLALKDEVAFTEGLRLEVGGVALLARRGTVRGMRGGLFVRCDP